MAVIKPVYTAVATAPVATGGVITTSVNPVVSRYVAIITAAMIGAADTTIPATSFVDDADAPVAAFPALTADDYYNVYVNGVLQQSSLSTLSTTDLVLDATDIAENVPVLLEIANFGGAVSTLTTPPTISAPTITIFT